MGECGKVYLGIRPDLDETRIRGKGTPADTQVGIFNGYVMPSWKDDDEELFFLICVPNRWDEESDILVHMKWATGGNENGNLVYWEMAWDHSSPNVVEAVPAGAVTQMLASRTVDSTLTYAHYMEYFIIDYDETPADSIVHEDTLALRLRHLPDQLANDPIAFEVAVLFARGDLLGHPDDILTTDDAENYITEEDMEEVGIQFGVFNGILADWAAYFLIWFGLLFVLGLSALAFWRFNAVMFMLVAGASLLLGFCWYDAFTTNLGLTLGLMAVAYSLVCLGFALRCIFWSNKEINEE